MRPAVLEQDIDKAVELYQAAHEQSCDEGTCALGVCYDRGAGVEADPQKAAELYCEAARQGYPRALHLAGQ